MKKYYVETRTDAEELDNKIDSKIFSVLIARNEYPSDCADICIYYKKA